jgi:hypothetical protein
VAPSHTLTPFEQRLARALAEARHQRARRHGIANARIGPQGDLETDLEGIAGELAFCALANVYPDLQLEELRPHDAIVGGVAYDVKTTRHERGRLLATMAKQGRAPDRYVLMVGQFPGPYECRGWFPSHLLLRPERVVDLGHGRGFAVPQEELIPW